MNESNVSNIYSMAHTLKIKKLKFDLERFIIENLLNPESSTNFFLDALAFESEGLRKACNEIIVKQSDAMIKTKEGAEFLSDMPFEAFLDFISSDNIEIKQEVEVVKMV